MQNTQMSNFDSKTYDFPASSLIVISTVAETGLVELKVKTQGMITRPASSLPVENKKKSKEKIAYLDRSMQTNFC